MKPNPSLVPSLRIAALAALATHTAQADLYAPYAVDANTLHLWHLDEAVVPAADSVLAGGLSLAVLGGGATLAEAGYTGFGTALSTVDGGAGVANGVGTDAYLAPLTLANAASDNVAWSFADPTTGAFTFEALVRFDFDPLTTQVRTSTMHILSGENESVAGSVRSFQFRLHPKGAIPNTDGFTTALTSPALEFISVRNGAAGQTENKVLVLPDTGTHAVAQGVWFHVAVAYNGNAGVADNLKYYWTKVDPTINGANLLGNKTLNNDLSPGQIDFAIGQIGRNPSQGNFVGAIDQVRISKVARGEFDFIFFPDTDNDDLADTWEVTHFIQVGEDPVADLATILARQDGTGDPDGDGANNEAEESAGSNPNNILSTPADTDADGLADTWEITEFGTLAQTGAADPDGDYATNEQEETAASDPENYLSGPDTEDGGLGDGLVDTWEVHFFGDFNLHTGLQDPDGDTFDNATEQTDRTAPNDPFSSADTDADGLPDGWELFYFTEVGEVPVNDFATIIARHDGTGDPDGDGSSNEAEQTALSNPTLIASRPYDIEGDGLIDAWEVQHFGNTTSQTGAGNADGDAFTNAEEQAAGSDPDVTASTPDDTDGDGTANDDETRVPYAVDANTLHLWDLDGSAAPVADRVYGPSNLPLLALESGATLANASFSGFGSALSTNAGYNTVAGAYLAAKTAGVGTTDTVLTPLAGSDGAFTYEAIVKFDVDPLAALATAAPRWQIFSAEEDNGQDVNRIFQFALTPVGSAGNTGTTPRVAFINIDTDPVTAGQQVQVVEVQMPDTGDHAPVQGQWFHLAVSYDGAAATAGNLKFYWTRLDSSAGGANLIGTAQMNGDLPAKPADVCIGNETRDAGGSSGPFQGLIDQVRVSDIARAAGAFMFNGDTDNDTLPDAWEIANFGDLDETASGDFDGDGTLNRTEFLLNLEPDNGSSFFSAAFAAGSTVQWQGVAGLQFNVERSTTLEAGSWTALNPSPIVAVNGLNSFPDASPPAGRAFYRVVLLTP